MRFLSVATFAFYAFISVSTINSLQAQTTLTAGDIAFTRIGMDSPDAFSFVFLVPIESGTVFYITDEGVPNNGTTFSDPTESTLRFTATSNIPAGEEVHVNTNGGPAMSFTGSSSATIEDIGVATGLSNFFGSTGDNLFAVQGTFNSSKKVVDSPTFIAGISANNGIAGTSGNAWQTSVTSVNTGIPSGQTNGQNGFLGLYPSNGSQSEVDNARYKTTATHSGDKATVLAAIMDLSNWEFDNTTAFSASSTAFSIESAAPSEAEVAVTVFLEGAYNGTDLNTTLNSNLPTSQPYSFNGHSGGSASSIPANAVDWVLVELREAGSAAAALAATKVGATVGFLMSDGTIKATDGTSNLSVSLSGNSGSEFYVVIYHRNHLPIMSANVVSEDEGVYSIDFTENSDNTYQNITALASLSGGKFGMVAGDIDKDGDIDATDLSSWRSSNGAVFSYSSNGKSDLNLDGVINAVDRNLFWKNNTSKTSQVPTT